MLDFVGAHFVTLAILVFGIFAAALGTMSFLDTFHREQ